MLPLVSIIVPNYNHRSYLKQRLDSIFNQTFQDFEVIIFDDASTDDSVSVLNEYKNNPKVTSFIINEINSGSTFQQWQKGVALSKGKYIWIAETDDFAENDFLKKTVQSLEENSEAVLVYSDSRIIDELGNTVGFWKDYKNTFFKESKWSFDYSIKGRKELVKFLSFKVTINNASATLFRKEVLVKEGILENAMSLKNVGDYYVYFKMALLGDIIYLKKPLNNYREHLNNTTKKNQKNGILYKESALCFLEMLDDLFTHKIQEDERLVLKKSLKYFIRKNSFSLLDFNYKNELNQILLRSHKYNLLSSFEKITFQLLFFIYSLKWYKVNGLSKKIIKKLCKY